LEVIRPWILIWNFLKSILQRCEMVQFFHSVACISGRLIEKFIIDASWDKDRGTSRLNSGNRPDLRCLNALVVNVFNAPDRLLFTHNTGVHIT